MALPWVTAHVFTTVIPRANWKEEEEGWSTSGTAPWRKEVCCSLRGIYESRVGGWRMDCGDRDCV